VRRTLLITLLAVLAMPVAASASSEVTTDGTLSVRNGHGRLVLIGFRGAAIGRVEEAKLTIVEPKGGRCDTPLVWGWDSVEEKLLLGGDLGEGRLACVYTGVEIRFRLVGAHEEISIRGSNIAVSVVGRGFAVLAGDGGFFDGTYSLNGLDYRSLPDEARRFTVGTPTTPPPKP
jgi:hypothetical protein